MRGIRGGRGRWDSLGLTIDQVCVCVLWREVGGREDKELLSREGTIREGGRKYRVRQLPRECHRTAPLHAAPPHCGGQCICLALPCRRGIGRVQAPQAR